ncbi:IS30 family transposase [Alteribacillus iranensis]|uniref:Transposase, IS30 family n=1 Tax=Alteribacillus iranensis TaxID=930128 RepID=A0A1I2EQU4_9BACI|nr:IS30 family transposase [Alteribacillus iranensis]SFE95189.1 transposase, IS30 family [Alteribacillus iranensis]
MSYQHLSTFERARIETLRSLNYSIRSISKMIHRSPSTVSRECRRNTVGNNPYCSETAQCRYHKRRRHCHPQGKWTKDLAQKIDEKLDLTWSPEQIAHRLFKGSLSFKTIYRWLYQGLLTKNVAALRHKGKRQRSKETRGRFNVGTSIKKRPKEIRKRKTFGHWELDSVVSSRGKIKGCLATFVERKTRWYIALKMPNRTAASMENAIRTLHGVLPERSFQTATVDRGKEFACYPTIENDLKIDVYFADPYSSWQRGSNENANGLLREFFPKASDLAKVTEEELERALALINGRPRKCLDWKTAHEAFEQEVLHLA